MSKKIIFTLSLFFVLFHVLTPLIGVIPGIGQRAIHIGLILVIYFLSSVFRSDTSIFQKVVDSLLVLASASSIIYLMIIDSTIDLRSGLIYSSDVFFGLLLIISLLEATRRLLGYALTTIVVLFIVYAFAGDFFPGFLSHPGLSLARFINIVYLSSDGIFGTALYASAVYIVLFIILGSLFVETGVGNYFTNIATSLFGRLRGGPAKVAVVSSGAFGSISGSAMANVVSTGTFTIPLMKKNGFKSEYAAGVEASASTGGQIMPPIMGATAFLIAEIIGIPYFELLKSALLPAIFFFIGILFTVDLYARKNNLKGLSADQLPKIKPILKKIYLIIPLIFLVVMLGIFDRTVMSAGIWTILVTLILVMLKKETRLDKAKVVKTIDGSINGATTVAIACAVVGIIIGVLSSSGLGFRLSSILVDVASGSILILLLLTMIVSIILGMGMPTTASYLVLAVMVAPALVDMGINPIAAHLFIFYFGIISNITPPVALAAFAASGIAKCSPNRAAIQGFKFSLSGFILPFMFVYNSALLMEGEWYDILFVIVTTLIGVYILSGALEKYFIAWKISILESIILFFIAILFIVPTILTTTFGLVLILLYISFKVIKSKDISILNKS